MTQIDPFAPDTAAASVTDVPIRPRSLLSGIRTALGLGGSAIDNTRGAVSANAEARRRWRVIEQELRELLDNPRASGPRGQ